MNDLDSIHHSTTLDLQKFKMFVRKERRKHSNGQSSQITPEEIKQLKDIGFRWKKRSRSGKRNRSRREANGATKKPRVGRP
jgi:hypothetical protein